MPNSCKLSLCLLFLCSRIYAQNQGGILSPSLYKSSVSGCYKKFYKKPENIDTLTNPLPHTAKRVWRMVDLNDEAAKNIFTYNKPCEYQDLFEVMKFGVLSGKVNSFSKDFFEGDIIKNKIGIEELQRLIMYRDTIQESVFDAEGHESTQTKTINRELNSYDLTGYLICEDWYFDRHWSELRKRIVYVSPVVRDEKNKTEYPLFYLYYKECREFFSSFRALNPRDKEYEITYDELFIKHLFPCFVVKKSNVFDRSIKDYKKGTDLIQEHYDTLDGLHNSESNEFGK